MNLAQLKSFIDLAASSGISELQIVAGDEKIRIVGTGASGTNVGGSSLSAPSKAKSQVAHRVPTESSPVVAPSAINAPMFGVCHLTPSPGAPAFVSVGDMVTVGQTLCLIEAMKMFTRVEATHAGVVKAILVESGNEVEAGQPLFQVA